MAAIDKAGVLRATDANGDPVSGAFLYFFEAGTTTPFTTYTDDALTVAHASPIVADSSGIFPAIYSANASLKIDMRTPGDVSLPGHPIDNIDFVDLVGLETAAASQTMTDNLFVIQSSASATTTLDVDMSGVSTGAAITMTVPNVDFQPATEADLTTAEGRVTTNETNITSLTSRMTAAEALVTAGVSYVDDALADLNARTGTADGEFAYVTDDGTASNNGIYQRISGTWTKQAEIPDFVATKASQADLDAEEAAREDAVEYLSFKVFAISDEVANRKIEVDHTAGDFGQVGIPQMRFEIGTSTYTIGDASAHEVFDLAEDNNPRVYIYANLTTLEFLSTPTKGTAAISGTIIPIGQSMYGQFTPYVGVEVETISDGVHYGAKLHRVSAVEAAPEDQFIEWDADAGTVTFPTFRMESGFGQTPANIPGATFAMSTATSSRIYYYVNITTGAIASTTTRSEAQNSTTVFRLGHSQNYGFTNETGMPVRIASEERRHLSGMNARATQQAIDMLPVPTYTGDRGAIVFEDAGWLDVQPSGYEESIITKGGGTFKFDCRKMINGTVANVVTKGASDIATIYAGAGSTFLNGETHCSVPALSAVQIHRHGVSTTNSLFVTSMFGSALTFSSPGHEQKLTSHLRAGQSHQERSDESGGNGGFSVAARSDTLLQTPLVPSIHWIDGATGATQILEVSAGTGTDHWAKQDGVGGFTNGPALTTCLAAITSETTGTPTQPLPTVVHMKIGRGDIAYQVSRTATPADLVSAITYTLDQIEAACHADVFFIIGMLGSEDGTNNPAATAVREAWLSIIASRANAHHGSEAYDLPRVWSEVHHTEVGYEEMNAREARIFANITDSQTNNTGPTINTAISSGGGLITTLTFTAGTNTAGDALDIVFPEGNFVENKIKGPNPLGFSIVAAGDDFGQTEIPILYAELFPDAVAPNVKLHTATSVTGARLCTVSGNMPRARYGEYISDNDVHARFAGYPLKTQIVTIA